MTEGLGMRDMQKTEENSGISADILTDNFETIAKAKGGVSKHRETTLKLVVQGQACPRESRR